jgi:transcriptional regulator with XRE-family HTH domain
MNRKHRDRRTRNREEASYSPSDLVPKLRSLRELKGLSLAEVAKRAGMARSNLCRLEQNGNNVKLETLQRYAAALDCELVVEVRESRTRTR